MIIIPREAMPIEALNQYVRENKIKIVEMDYSKRTRNLKIGFVQRTAFKTMEYFIDKVIPDQLAWLLVTAYDFGRDRAKRTPVHPLLKTFSKLYFLPHGFVEAYNMDLRLEQNAREDRKKTHKSLNMPLVKDLYKDEKPEE